MTTRATFTITVDLPSNKSNHGMAGYLEGVFDYLNATVEIVEPPEADPMHNEGEGQ